MAVRGRGGARCLPSGRVGGSGSPPPSVVCSPSGQLMGPLLPLPRLRATGIHKDLTLICSQAHTCLLGGC